VLAVKLFGEGHFKQRFSVLWCQQMCVLQVTAGCIRVTGQPELFSAFSPCCVQFRFKLAGCGEVSECSLLISGIAPRLASQQQRFAVEPVSLQEDCQVFDGLFRV
jgi:hypothetical protein